MTPTNYNQAILRMCQAVVATADIYIYTRRADARLQLSIGEAYMGFESDHCDEKLTFYYGYWEGSLKHNRHITIQSSDMNDNIALHAANEIINRSL